MENEREQGRVSGLQKRDGGRVGTISAAVWDEV